jgi:V-type H+-transporting ATPase subunit H
MSFVRDKIMGCSPAFYAHPEAYSEVSNYVSPKAQEYESAGIIPSGSADTYRNFITMSLDNQRKFLVEEAESVIRVLLAVLESSSDDVLCKRSILCTLDGIANDVSTDYFIKIMTSIVPVNILQTLTRHAKVKEEDAIVKEASAHFLSLLLSELIIRPSGTILDAQAQALSLIDFLLNKTVDNKSAVDAMLYCMIPLFNVDEIRKFFLKTGGLRLVIIPILTSKSGVTQSVYIALFALWQITFNEESVEYFLRKDYELISLIVKEIRKTEKEKVLRVGLGTLKNLCGISPIAIEIMVEEKLLDVIDNLSRKVLKDEDVIELIKSVGEILQKNVKILSTYEKWLHELNRGELVPGVTHTENFWKENSKKLEESNFDSLKKLVLLLQSSNTSTVVLALFDVGEFGRFHPFGKSITTRIGAKSRAMELMQSTNPEISLAALLCVQKLIIQNWQNLT